MSTSLSCGLIGLPNVGKSTLFNAILKTCSAQAANYPFCTIEPNVGHAPIEDNRLNILAKISNSEKKIKALLKCVDIAGMIKNAHKGEGLGNQFLGHIRECDLILHVVRCFKDDNVLHVEGDVNPLRDYEIITLEMQFADIDKLDKIIEQKKIESQWKDLANSAKKYLVSNYFLGNHWSKDQLNFFTKQGLLTHKPMIVIANMKSIDDAQYLKQIQHLNPIPVFATIEAELDVFLNEAETDNQRNEILYNFGLIEKNNQNNEQFASGLSLILKQAYEKLGLITFFTTGKQESRAWKLKKGSTMQDAAGVIHTDFYKSFISADVVKYEQFVRFNSWQAAKDHGALRTCAKSAIIEDGDVCVFKTFC